MGFGAGMLAVHAVRVISKLRRGSISLPTGRACGDTELVSAQAASNKVTETFRRRWKNCAFIVSQTAFVWKRIHDATVICPPFRTKDPRLHGGSAGAVFG